MRINMFAMNKQWCPSKTQTKALLLCKIKGSQSIDVALLIVWRGTQKQMLHFKAAGRVEDGLWFMLKRVASKRRLRHLNKLNKSIVIHSGLQADQRRTSAASNIPQWMRGPGGRGEQLEVEPISGRRQGNFALIICCNTCAREYELLLQYRTVDD